MKNILTKVASGILVGMLFTGTAFAQTASDNSSITQDNDTKTITKTDTDTTTIDKSMHDSQKVRINCKQVQVNKPENKPDSEQKNKQEEVNVQLGAQTPSGSPSAEQTISNTQDQASDQSNDQTADQSNTQTQENCDISINNNSYNASPYPYPSFSPSVTNVTNITNPASVVKAVVPSYAPATGRGV